MPLIRVYIPHDTLTSGATAWATAIAVPVFVSLCINARAACIADMKSVLVCASSSSTFTSGLVPVEGLYNRLLSV